MNRSQDFMEKIKDTSVKYRVYYIDNDRQKKIVDKDFTYQQAVKFCQVHSKEYGTDLSYEVQ